MMRKGGMVSSLPFLILLLIVGIALFAIAGIMLADSQDRIDLTSDITIEQQIAFTVSSGAVLQIPHGVLMTEYQGEKVIDIMERFAFCRYRQRDYGCGEERMVTESEVNDALENRMNAYFQEEVLGDRPYFIRIIRNGEEIHAMSRGVETVVREGRTRPQFGRKTTSVRNPVALPGEDTASVEFEIPLGGMDVSSFERGGS